MNRIEFKSSTILTYEEFMKTVTTDSSFSLKLNGNIEKTLDNFIDWIDKKFSSDKIKSGLLRVDYEFLVKYFDYTFNYWLWRYDERNLKSSKHGLKSIQLNWCIGPSAIKRFEANSEKVEFTRFDRQLRKAGVKILDKLKSKTEEQKEAFRATFLSGANSIEEEEKEMFHNQPTGLLNCISNTTLYNPKSKFCESCNSRMLCKEVLKKQIPNLYKLRFNE